MSLQTTAEQCITSDFNVKGDLLSVYLTT